MKIFVGLGNPTAEYANTKHNVGFMLADRLAKELNASEWRNNFDALIAETFIDSEKILIVKPQTYMNKSGDSVGKIVSFYKVDVSDLIVAHDDMDLPTGMIRLRPKGNAGGHHGVESIIQALGNDNNFRRVRIGIGRPPERWDVISHVLSRFNAEDSEKISAAIEILISAIVCIVRDGIDVAMNKFNPKKKKIVDKNPADVIQS